MFIEPRFAPGPRNHDVIATEELPDQWGESQICSPARRMDFCPAAFSKEPGGKAVAVTSESSDGGPPTALTTTGEKKG